MARGEIKIPMAVDTGGIEKSIKNGLVEPLEDAEDALKALTKVDAGRDLERDLDKAQDATEDLKEELEDARSDLKKLGFAAKDAGDDAKRGFKGAEDGVKEMGEEANSTAKEAAASFDGSAESILDAFQEVAANAFAGFGPAGALAGLAIAAGIGIAVGKFQEAEEAAEELRMKAVEYASDAVEAGVSTEAWISSAGRLVERIRELEEAKSTDFRWFWEDDPSQLEEWSDALKITGQGADELGKVLGSTDEAVQDYRDAMQDARDATVEQGEALAANTALADEAGMAKVQALEDEIAGYDDLLQALDQEIDTREQSAESAQRQRDAGVEQALATAAAEEEKAERIASAEQVVQDSVTSAYDSMRDAATEYATTEDGALDINRWLEYTQQHAAAVATYQANLQSMKLSPDQWSNLMEMPEDARMQWVSQFVALPEAARDPYAAALNDLGSSGGSSAAVAFDDSFNPNADVEINAETGAAEADLEDVSRDRTAEIKVKTTGKAEAKSDLEALAKTRHATINVRADTSDANASINTMRRNQESRPVYVTVKARNGGSLLV
ncbi:hypothetical protein [Microbacterium sp. LWH10-1.2]|uniref:hypothetical protein n=1 Tax=Microbacterium sp. LWH10-1.2 TaxID=3135255 RepID=UPI00313871A5